MDFTRNPRRNLQKQADVELDSQYPHDLQLYDKIPTNSILIHDFEEIALERLKALRIIETVTLRGFVKYSEEWRKNFHEELKKQELKPLAKLYSSPGVSGTTPNYEARRRDHISHFILCLAFCRTDELRNWFINKELDLFMARFEELTIDGRKDFLQINNIDFKPIPVEEKKSKLAKFINTFQLMNATQIDLSDFYKVPFRRVLDLVKIRRVYLEKGQAYVASGDLGNLIASKLRQEISHSLAVMRQCLPETTADIRLDSVLKCLLDQYESGTYKPTTTSSDSLRIEDLDDLSKKSFPPCMRRMHETLRLKHHLRHAARMQYGLFLKGAGLSLEDALKFWRSEFVKVMAVEKFEKEYGYNIRYNYGKEGKRCNFSPYGCNKIINSQPGPEDASGCPFKHSKPLELRKLILSYGIDSNQGLKDVMEYVNTQQPVLACQKLFVLSQPGKGVEFGLCHPNQYFTESRMIITGANVKQEPASETAATPSTTYNSPASTYATPSPSNIRKNINSSSTPLNTKATTVARDTPASSRKALNVNKAGKAEPLSDVSDWLDEMEDNDLSQIEAMDTTA
ncbi:DNA primase large subunit [Neocloeon triangulifer]|uniref:DNA primase large subunit n=1 Tax=Neocloeon triangulifer TaxID=2078957 RepID=UPI00286F13CC|nr:DNA primase large subunit [Neocloeon triangulifer]